MASLVSPPKSPRIVIPPAPKEAKAKAKVKGADKAAEAAEKRKERRRAAGIAGRESTMLTGGGGVAGRAPVRRKTLLGR